MTRLARFLPDVSVVIPVYNSEASLAEVVESTQDVLRREGLSAEFILVDDSSRDGSWSVITHLSSALDNVRGLRLRRNYGQHSALLAGIRLARAPLIVTMDDDLQHPAVEIPKLLKTLEDGQHDVVYGYPARLPFSFLRNLTSWTTKVVLRRAMGAETARHASAFRAFRTSLRDAFEDYRSAYVSIDVLLTWATQRFSWTEVEFRPRPRGRSGYTYRKLMAHALTMVTGFSTLPLRLATIVGLSFTALGIALLIYVLARYVIEGGSVPGFPFLASAIAIFSGVQLFALGIIGEYLARIHVRSLGRPAYVIGERAGAATAEHAQEREHEQIV